MLAFKTRSQIIASRDKQIGAWASRKIRFLEAMARTRQYYCNSYDTHLAYHEGFEDGKERGMLEGFYQLQEFMKINQGGNHAA